MTTTDLRLDVADLYAAYGAALDAGDFEQWPGFFMEDCRYRLMARENFDAGLPLCVIDLQSRNALMDRVYGVQSTLFHAPYYQRHIIGLPRITQHTPEMVFAEASYLVIRTKRDMPSEILNVGRYVDRIAITADGLRFADKLCVYDSELIPNSIIYPI